MVGQLMPSSLGTLRANLPDICLPTISSPLVDQRLQKFSIPRLVRSQAASSLSVDSAEGKTQRSGRLVSGSPVVLSNSLSPLSRESSIVLARASAVAEAPVATEDLVQELILEGTLEFAEDREAGGSAAEEMVAALESLYNGLPAPSYRIPFEDPRLQGMLQFQWSVEGNSLDQSILQQKEAFRFPSDEKTPRRPSNESLLAGGDDAHKVKMERRAATTKSTDGSLRMGKLECAPSASTKVSKRGRPRKASLSKQPVPDSVSLDLSITSKPAVQSGSLTAYDGLSQAAGDLRESSGNGLTTLKVVSEHVTKSRRAMKKKPTKENHDVPAKEVSYETAQTCRMSGAEASTGHMYRVDRKLFSANNTHGRPATQSNSSPISSVEGALASGSNWTQNALRHGVVEDPVSRGISAAVLATPLYRDYKDEGQPGKALGAAGQSLSRLPGVKFSRGFERLKARQSSQAKQLKKQRRLSLSSRINLNCKLKSVDGQDRITRRWEELELPGTAKDMTAEELDSLVRDYAKYQAASSQWMSTGRANLPLAEQIRLGYLIQPIKPMETVRVQLAEDLGREPSISEWAEAVHLSPSALRGHLILRKAARNKLMQHHIGLVLMMAHHFHGPNLSFSVKDLCQFGIQGLASGTDKWDPSKGIHFSVYIKYWIKNSILRNLTTQGYFMRAPAHLGQAKLTLSRAKEELRKELGRQPTLEEVAARTGMKPAKCRLVWFSFQSAQSLNATNPVTGSEAIDDLTRPGDGIDLGCDNPQIRFAIDDVLDSLKPRESLVLRQRFGLDGGGQRSFGEISKVLNCSREMVRKYEMQGLAKMRHPVRMEYLRSHIVE